MKKSLIILIIISIIGLIGCSNQDITSNQSKELIKLGFFQPEPVHSININSPFNKWSVYLKADDNNIFNVIKADNGWIYYPGFDSDEISLIKSFDIKSGVEIVSMSQSQENTPSVIVKVKNRDFYGYRNWNLIKTGSFGTGYYIFYKTSESTWGPQPNLNYSEPGYISNISIEKIKQDSMDYFQKDPFGKELSTEYSDIYSVFWDLEKGQPKT